MEAPSRFQAEVECFTLECSSPENLVAVRVRCPAPVLAPANPQLVSLGSLDIAVVSGPWSKSSLRDAFFREIEALRSEVHALRMVSAEPGMGMRNTVFFRQDARGYEDPLPFTTATTLPYFVEEDEDGPAPAAGAARAARAAALRAWRYRCQAILENTTLWTIGSYDTGSPCVSRALVICVVQSSWVPASLRGDDAKEEEEEEEPGGGEDQCPLQAASLPYTCPGHVLLAVIVVGSSDIPMCIMRHVVEHKGIVQHVCSAGEIKDAVARCVAKALESTTVALKLQAAVVFEPFLGDATPRRDVLNEFLVPVTAGPEGTLVIFRPTVRGLDAGVHSVVVSQECVSVVEPLCMWTCVPRALDPDQSAMILQRARSRWRVITLCTRVLSLRCRNGGKLVVDLSTTRDIVEKHIRVNETPVALTTVACMLGTEPCAESIVHAVHAILAQPSPVLLRMLLGWYCSCLMWEPIV